MRLSARRYPRRIQFHPPALDQVRHGTDDCRYLAIAGTRNFFEACALVEKGKSLVRRGRSFSSRHDRARSGVEIPQHLKDLGSIDLSLSLADARNLPKSRQGRWTPAAQFFERAVVQD